MTARPELTRRLGEASRAFKSLVVCWSHANISRARKIEIYMSSVGSKLMYNLETLWLLKADINRLEAFHVKCLRRICRIPHSYVSRVRNDTVLNLCAQQPLHVLLHKRQVQVYRKNCEMPDEHFLKALVYDSQNHCPRQWLEKRKRGRPKLQWAHCVFKLI